MEIIQLNGFIPMNCFVLERNKECYIIDPGYFKEEIQQYINNKGYVVLGILLTHGHLDHIGAIDCFDVPIYIHTNDYDFIFDDFKSGFSVYGMEKDYDPKELNIIKTNRETKLLLNNKEIEVIHTPGHTSGGVCYKYENEILVGDTIFKNSIGRYDLPTGDQSTLSKSIIKLLDNYKEECILYPAHGPSTTIEHEKKYNEYYKLWKKGKLLGNQNDELYIMYEEARKLCDKKQFNKSLELFLELKLKGFKGQMLDNYINYLKSLV